MTRLRIHYLARRNPSIPAQDWTDRWRRHWELAASMPTSATVRRYVQCRVLADLVSPPHDGVATAECHSAEHRAHNRSDAEYHAVMQRDELEVFDRLIEDCSFVAEHRVIDGAGSGPWKVIRYVSRAAGSSRDDFVELWATPPFEMLQEKLPGLVSRARDVAVESAPRERWGLDVDGAEELWFASRDDALKAVGDGSVERLDLAAAPLVTTAARVVTDEVVLKDWRRPDQPPVVSGLGRALQ